MTHNHILLAKLLQEVERGNVFKMEHNPEYVLFKYTPECHHEDRWNATSLQARGIIFHMPTAQIVCRPFDKFFNLDERPSTKLENLPNTNFVVWEKLDGSCCSSFLMNGKLFCSTPGSYMSDQAIWATNWLRKHLASINKLEKFIELNTKLTFIFEGIWPPQKGNPSPGVLNYGDREELVLLAVRRHSGQELNPLEYANEFLFNTPKLYNSKDILLDRNLKDKIPDNEEGYVVQFSNGLRIKVKSPVYMTLHKFCSAITYKGICEILEGGESRRYFANLPKHIAQRADDIIAELNQEYYKTFYKIEDCYNKIKDLPTRKEQALEILKDNRDISSLVFLKLDNKLYDRLIWSFIKKTYKGEEYEPA